MASSAEVADLKLIGSHALFTLLTSTFIILGVYNFNLPLDYCSANLQYKYILTNNVRKVS